MRHVIKSKLTLITLACIFAGTLFCKNAHAQDHHITAVVNFDNQLGTTKIQDTKNVGVHVSFTFDGLDTPPAGTYTYNWGISYTNPEVSPPDTVTVLNVNTSSNTLSTDFNTAGVYSIRVYCQVSFVSASGNDYWYGEGLGDVTQTVIGGDFTTSGDKVLYYFCGAPVGVGNPQTVSVPSQPPGTTETWTTSAALTVDTTNNEIKGVAGSSNKGWDWIQISYSLNGVTWTSPMHSSYTVLKPTTLNRLGVINAAAIDPQTFTPVGYSSGITYELLDQFGEAMPNTGINENFGTFSSDYAGENWPSPHATGGNTNAAGTFPDTFTAEDPEGIYQPSPQTPANPLGTTKILHGSQTYYAGSSTPGQGCMIEAGTLQYYRDHADHEG